MSAKIIGIAAVLIAAVLTCANGWALYMISDLKSDIREERAAATASSTALTARIDAAGQNVATRIGNLVSSGATIQALQSKEGQKLSAAIIETRAAVDRIQATTNDNKVTLATIQGDIGSLTKTISFMQGQLSQAPWIKR